MLIINKSKIKIFSIVLILLLFISCSDSSQTGAPSVQSGQPMQPGQQELPPLPGQPPMQPGESLEPGQQKLPPLPGQPMPPSQPGQPPMQPGQPGQPPM
ncbi:MAG: hypothetical protein CL733_03150, partial [Chloroflexi bacterium]|nr:hypothetical protein [Chloroflexota bacterium]